MPYSAETRTIKGHVFTVEHQRFAWTDTDFVVKRIDVYPGDAKDPVPNPGLVHMGGFQMLLAGDIPA